MVFQSKDKVQDFNNEEEEVKKKTKAENMREATKINTIGKVIFIMICVLFNIVFWAVAVNEYVRPAEVYI